MNILHEMKGKGILCVNLPGTHLENAKALFSGNICVPTLAAHQNHLGKLLKNPDGISYVMGLGRAVVSQRVLTGFLEGSNVYSGLRAPGGSEGKVTVRDGVKVASGMFP